MKRKTSVTDILEQERRAMALRRTQLVPSANAGHGCYQFSGLDWRPTEGLWLLAEAARVSFYEAAWMAEGLRCDECNEPATSAEEIWTPSRVSRLTTAEILQRMAALHVQTSEERFLADFEGEWSITLAALRSLELATVTTVHDEDFFVLAMSELSRRWPLEAPSRERLLEPLLRGDQRLLEDQRLPALDAWCEFWTQLRVVLPAEVRSRKAVDEWLSTTRRFRRWTERLTAVAGFLASENPAAAKRAAEVSGEVGVLLGD